MLRTLHGSVSPTDHALDGVAVVSDIFASVDPAASALKLRSILKNFQLSFAKSPLSLVSTVDSEGDRIINRESVLERVRRVMQEIRKKSPLIHQAGCSARSCGISEGIIFLGIDNEHCGANSSRQCYTGSRRESYYGNRGI